MWILTLINFVLDIPQSHTKVCFYIFFFIFYFCVSLCIHSVIFVTKANKFLVRCYWIFVYWMWQAREREITKAKYCCARACCSVRFVAKYHLVVVFLLWSSPKKEIKKIKRNRNWRFFFFFEEAKRIEDNNWNRLIAKKWPARSVYLNVQFHSINFKKCLFILNKPSCVKRNKRKCKIIIKRKTIKLKEEKKEYFIAWSELNLNKIVWRAAIFKSR